MRIVITQNGTNEIQTINPRTTSRNKIKKHNPTETKSLSTSNEELVPKIRNILIQNITQKKIAIPPDMNEKYNNSDEPSTNTLNEPNLLSNVLISIHKSMEETSASKLPIICQAFPLKNIISPNRYQQLQEEVTARNKSQAKEIKVTENNFRSEVFDDIEKDFEMQSCKPINIQNRNLIEYLNTDNTLSTKYVKKLAQHDENRIRKLNKICQKVIYYKDQEEIIRNIVQQKLKGEILKDREFYYHRLEEMKSNLKQSHSLLDQDIPKINKRERYTYQQRKMENEWSKYNIGRLYKKQSKPIYTSRLSGNQLNTINELFDNEK